VNFVSKLRGVGGERVAVSSKLQERKQIVNPSGGSGEKTERFSRVNIKEDDAKKATG